MVLIELALKIQGQREKSSLTFFPGIFRGQSFGNFIKNYGQNLQQYLKGLPT
jgi:hypothetical protein